MNGILPGTYRQLTNYFLREARSCFSSRAYRMAVVAAATSTHLGMYFYLLTTGHYDQSDRVPSFSQVISKARDEQVFRGDILKDAEWLMNTRNAFAHPEDWIITESTPVPNKFDIAWYDVTFRTKYKIEPKEVQKVKGRAFIICCNNNLGALKEEASKAIKKTEEILMRVLGGYECGNVEDWKKSIEQQLGGNIDLESLPF